MSIILIDTFHYLSSSHPYTELLEHYSVQVSQPVSSLFVIGLICIWIITDIEVYLGVVRVLTGSQKADILKVGLWQTA